MTAQQEDFVTWNGKNYIIAGISKGEIYTPVQHGIAPVQNYSGCWRGYYAVYVIEDNQLKLSDLWVDVDKETVDSAPLLNGIKPSSGNILFNLHYSKLNYALRYTGGLILVDELAQGYVDRSGFQPPWKFETAYELYLENGELTSFMNRSSDMKVFRAVVSQKLETNDEVFFKENPFYLKDRSYNPVVL